MGKESDVFVSPIIIRHTAAMSHAGFFAASHRGSFDCAGTTSVSEAKNSETFASTSRALRPHVLNNFSSSRRPF
jgi:hypothetical protein|tara:strand:- start:350 stop:571 length:222 start_codon:yes stop_codon:yes gene_type:complete